MPASITVDGFGDMPDLAAAAPTIPWAALVRTGWSEWRCGTDRDPVLRSAGHDLIEVLAPTMTSG
jgi:hypothetical protein